MKQRALIEIVGLEVFHDQRAGRECRGHRGRAQRVRHGRAGAGLIGPDRGEVALARSFGADQQHGARRPFRPALDQAEARCIRRSFQEIVAREALRMRQREGQLTGLNANCH